jgi:hypothetical protein
MQAHIAQSPEIPVELLLLQRGEFLETIARLGIDGVALRHPGEFNCVHSFPV